MTIFHKTKEFLKHKFKISKNIKQEIKMFEKARAKLLKHMIKKQIISQSQINIHKIFITFFGCGKVRYGPGTLASLAAVIVWFCVSYIIAKSNIFSNVTNEIELIFWIIISAIIFIYGLIAIPIYEEFLNRHDDPSIVIDEVVGQFLALALTYPFVKKYYFDNTILLNQLIMTSHLLLSFILFRFLDIAKPAFIGWVDKNVQGSFGVMLDDLICAIVTSLINIAIFAFYLHNIKSLHNIM